MNKILTIAALALVLSACSNEDNDIQTPVEQPAKSEGIPFTATISIGESAMTRALTEDATNNQIVPTWATGEKVALIYTVGSTPTKTDAEVTKQADGTATISATLESGATNGSDVTIIYPSTAADGTTGNVLANLLAAQDGTLATIATNYDVRKGTGKLSINDEKATVNNGTAGTTVSLTNQNAIFKFTLSGPTIDASHPLVIKKGENEVVTTVTPTSSTTSVYVAMPPAASSTYKFFVKTNNNKYIKSGTAVITAGKYYQTTLNMPARYPLALANATKEDLGSVIGADGKIYLNMTAATNASTTAVAMIAYLGSETGVAGYTHGLALALSDESDKMHWTTATGASGAAAHTPAAPTPITSSWMLPSKDQWDKMIDACKNVLGTQNNFKDLRDGFSGISGASNLKPWYYWSSTEGDSGYAWCYYFVGGYASNHEKDMFSNVRACLAF